MACERTIMDILKVNDDLSVAGQIQPKDLDVLAAMGFKSIICNRPDGEGEFQPLFEAVESEARNSGVRAMYVPVAPSGPTSADAAHFGKVFDALPKPVLAYCRTGGRSQATWSASQAGRVT
jgi:sulfide:quinone oxidoreductase